MAPTVDDTAERPIAVIGMACRLPGAENLDQFWDMIQQGRHALGPAPADRLDRERYYDPQVGVPGKTYTDLAGLVNYRPVDRDVCPLPEEWLETHDVAHLTLCEVAAHACRDARFEPTAVPYANTGVYVGHAAASDLGGRLNYAMTIAETAEYLRDIDAFRRLPGACGDAVIGDIVDRVRRENPRRQADGSPYLGASVAANLISRAFCLNGPYMSFNAACASSLQAVAHATRALQTGRIDMAIVGGASYFDVDTLILFSQARSVSVSGSHPFTADADGMVVGEGYVVIVLKTLERALADGDPIRGVLRGVGVSSDGRGKSLWAPRAEGQIEAIVRAYNAQVSLDRLQYVEAHATSTALGDATELEALGQVLDGKRPLHDKIPVGSAKFNVGHTLETAGLVGLTKVVLALQHGVIPPTTDGRPLNPKIDWDRMPVVVPGQPRMWPAPSDGGPRRAGVNAFGIGGLNVHVVVDEFAPSPSLSARVPGMVGSRTAVPPATTARQEAIAIVGMGAVLPGARTFDDLWDLVNSGRDPKVEVPPERWNARVYKDRSPSPWTTPTTIGGFITDFEYDWRKHRIPPKQIAQASPLQFMILDAVDHAFQQAGVAVEACDRRRVGVVVGTIFGGDFASQLSMGLRLPEFQATLERALRQRGIDPAQIHEIVKAYAGVLLKRMPALLDETGSFTSSGLASRITKAFDLMGGAVAVDAGTASSTAALECCVDVLCSGTCDMMICIGAQQDMGPAAFVDRSVCGLLADGRPRAPFDAAADGIVPGEGCGVLLLKRLSDARRGGDTIHGIIRSVGSAFSTSRRQAVRLAATRALQSANLNANDIWALETASIGQPTMDAEEIQGIAEAYAARNKPTPMWLGTLVGQIGHLGGASGMASLLKATMALQHGSMPTPGEFERAASFLAPLRSLLAVRLPNTPPRATNIPPGKFAAVNSCGGVELVHHVLLEQGITMRSPTPIYDTPEFVSHADSGERNVDTPPIEHFDATVRRRERMRQQANAAPGTAPGTAPQVTPALPESDAPPATVSAVPEPLASSKRPAAPAESPIPKKDELAKFLVQFVVDRAELPPEMVDLDTDLEADLGIDFFKKAQLLAELHEHFGIVSWGDRTPDDFPTIQQVQDHILDRLATGSPSNETAVVEPTEEAPASDLSPEPQAVANGVSAQPLAVTLPAAPEPPATNEAPPVAESAPDAPDAEHLAEFLVNFVVEQTGYPPEIVELSAYLEGDLGIDSIKTALLFGELGEYFDVQPDDDLTLDDFPTLHHVLDYLTANIRGSRRTQELPATGATVEPVQGRVSSTPATAATLPSAASPTHHELPASQPASSAPSPEQLAAFLVNFVVEQTGYPPEIVELDADLEADLGIDSIKKAQLFGELGEYFDVQPDDDLTLDDFPTLRHVLNYLADNIRGASDSTDIATRTSME